MDCLLTPGGVNGVEEESIGRGKKISVGCYSSNRA